MRGRALWIAVALLVVAMGASLAYSADDDAAFRIIVHPENHFSALDRKFLEHAFLKKRTRWPDDRLIEPVDLHPDSPARKRFSRQILHRPVSAVKSYWQQLIFSGRGVPPPELDADQVVGYVLEHRGAIGYVPVNVDLRGARVVEAR